MSMTAAEIELSKKLLHTQEIAMMACNTIMEQQCEMLKLAHRVEKLEVVVEGYVISNSAREIK